MESRYVWFSQDFITQPIIHWPTLTHKRTHTNLISENGKSGGEYDKRIKTTVHALLGQPNTLQKLRIFADALALFLCSIM